ncbi:MAG: hypothetical protein WC197_06520 [Candidatus Gastranaerophilaceae bacterium]|jgi:hypothetical protein
MAGGINGSIAGQTNADFYKSVDAIMAGESVKPTNKEVSDINFAPKPENNDKFISSKPQEKSEKEPEEKPRWGLLKTAAVVTAGIAAFKTGNGLGFKGKDLKEIATTICSKDTVTSFIKNINPTSWFK